MSDLADLLAAHAYDAPYYACQCQDSDDPAFTTWDRHEWATHVAQVLTDAGYVAPQQVTPKGR